ncbi:hypothetical protein JW921_10070 [Candidatus Fermentibacterales bacterium]|nr:hypothetical protein [Candidatus Fermentibacterales bacterium]
MRNARAWLAAIAALALLAGCGDSPSGGEIADEDYFPHGLGSSWEYGKAGLVDTLGLTFTLTGSRVTTVTSVLEQSGGTLVEMTNLGLDTLYLPGVDTLPLPIPPRTIARMRTDGIWVYGDSTMQDSTWLVRFPLVVGNTWTSHSDPDVESEIVSMTEEVIVPDGTFSDVLHVRATQSTAVSELVTDYYFAPDVGSIMTEIAASVVGQPPSYESSEKLEDHLVY